MYSRLDLYCAYKPLNKIVEKRPAESLSFMFDNQCYVVTEQVIRHIQESLSVSIGMMTPSGEVMLISPIQHSTLYTVLLNHYMDQQLANLSKTSTTPAQGQNEPMPSNLQNNFKSQVKPGGQPNQPNSEMKKTPSRPSCAEAGTQYPSCSKSTSCTDFVNHHRTKKLKRDSDINDVNRRQLFELNHCPYIKRLSARKQRKLRKLFQENEYSSDNDSSWV